MAKHLALGKKYTASGIVAELLTLLETVTADGVITEDESKALKDWLDLNKTEQSVPGIEFLRTTVNQVLADGRVMPEEKLALYKAVERVLPPEARLQARERRTAIEAVQKAHRRDARTAKSEQRRLERESRVANVNFMVAGVTYEGRAAIVRRYVRENAPAFLARDPGNPHDRNAIEIRLDNGYHIGFMPRDYAESVAPFLDAGYSHKAYFTRILQGRRTPIPIVQAYVYAAGVEIEGAVPPSQIPIKRQPPIAEREPDAPRPQEIAPAHTSVLSAGRATPEVTRMRCLRCQSEVSTEYCPHCGTFVGPPPKPRQPTTVKRRRRLGWVWWMIVICVVIGSWITAFKGDRPDPAPRKDIKVGEYRAPEPARREEQSPRRPTGNAIPLEQKLATIDGVEFDDVKVKRFRSLLLQLDGAYVEDQEQIADMTAKAKQLLADEGISETLLNILEGMNQVFTAKIDNQKYAEYVAPYVTLRKKGHSHREAVRGLAAIVNSLTAR